MPRNKLESLQYKVEVLMGKLRTAQDEVNRLKSIEHMHNQKLADSWALKAEAEKALGHLVHELFEYRELDFYRETGIMAPGKSVPLEMGGRWTDEERATAWKEWLRSR